MGDPRERDLSLEVFYPRKLITASYLLLGSLRLSVHSEESGIEHQPDLGQINTIMAICFEICFANAFGDSYESDLF